MNAAASDQAGDAVDDGAGEGHGKLAEALVRVFLALGIGVGEQAADGEQQDGAQAQTKIGGHDAGARFLARLPQRRRTKKSPMPRQPA